MNLHNRPKELARLKLISLAALLIIALVLTVPSLQNAQAANGDSLAVTYSRGSLHVTIPYHALHAGEGQLAVEILDPDDKIIGRSEQQAGAGEAKGLWQADLKLAKAVSIEDLAWHR